jgi:hypothetical protein
LFLPLLHCEFAVTLDPGVGGGRGDQSYTDSNATKRQQPHLNTRSFLTKQNIPGSGNRSCKSNKSHPKRNRSPACRPKRRGRTKQTPHAVCSRTLLHSAVCTVAATALLAPLLTDAGPDCALDRICNQNHSRSSNRPPRWVVLHTSPCLSATPLAALPSRRSLRAVSRPSRRVIDSSTAYSSRQKKAIQSAAPGAFDPRSVLHWTCCCQPASQLGTQEDPLLCVPHKQEPWWSQLLAIGRTGEIWRVRPLLT